jgi:hypothetical protein
MTEMFNRIEAAIETLKLMLWVNIALTAAIVVKVFGSA